jgi:hypothetical protein
MLQEKEIDTIVFKKDQTILVKKEEDGIDSDWYTAKVIGFLKEWPKKEAMYHFSYDKPLPQLVVFLDDGSQQRYFGQETIDKFVKTTKEDFKHPKLLSSLLEEIVIDLTPSLKSLGEDCDDYVSQKLIEMEEFKRIILPFITPILDKNVFDIKNKNIVLDEFDSSIIAIKSEKISMHGSHSFEINIYIHGYDPMCFDIKIR